MPNTALIGVVNITTLNTAQQLPSVRGASGGIAIKALPANSGTVWIGASDVDTTHGWPLAAGDGITFPIQQLSKLYVYGAANDKIAYASVGNP